MIAAIALALRLADVVENANGKVRLDTIFIDEGFGSLDTATAPARSIRCFRRSIRSSVRTARSV
ncbi:hypothetical protein [Sinorhizobium mexicanum]|uniref:hypothetical protein n=1 Tax=Sinorhizobium mexicanum TaxID=375549 RepID=UPI003CC91FBF